MRRILFFAFLALGLTGYAQDTLKPAYSQALQDRQLLYDSYTSTKSTFDSTEASYKILSANMEQIIVLDDKLINENLIAETGRADSLSTRVQELEKTQNEATAAHVQQTFYFLIASAAAGLFFILFIVLLVILLSKGKKNKKIKDQLTEKDEQLTMQQGRLEETENEYKLQVEQLTNNLESAKSQSDRDNRTFRSKEDEYKSQVQLIDEKIKKANQKESDLNYQVFQLELRLKNELETTIAQKCALENKVTELERELSETRLRMSENQQQPQTDVRDLENRIAGLEWELTEARQKIEEAPQQPQGDVQELQTKIEELERELSEVRLRSTDDLENAPADVRELQDLRGKVEWYASEAKYFREVIANNQQEKESMHAELDALRTRAEEAGHLQDRINELMQFMEHFRQGN